MKRLISLLLLFIFPIMNLSQLQFHPDCEKVNKTQPFNYLGTSLTISSDGPEDLLLCPGDTFGDLDGTYVKIQDCNLTMYHKDKIIWSKGRRDYFTSEGECPNDDYCTCIFYLERDGNLVLYQEEIKLPWRGSIHSRMNYHKTYGSTKIDLRLKDQQLQTIWTFSDGTQRLFYLDENHQGFTEDLGEPTKIADKLVIKSHQDKDKTILRRNEYIGDLNGTYLILQINCQLQLLNKNEIIWSLAPYFGIFFPCTCTLDVAQDNTIQISRRWMNQILSGHENRQSVIESEANLEVIESRITLGDSEPIIIQTLKNGSELIFYGGRLKRQPKQIAQKTLTIFDKSVSIERMEYIGNLTGLHLILEQNCSLILANGNEKLWESQSEPQIFAAIRCLVHLEPCGRITLCKSPRDFHPMLERSSSEGEFILGAELKLENDQIVVKCKRKDRDSSEIFYAGRQTNGTFFRFIAHNSMTVTNRDHPYAEILPKMGYIGDLNGMYVLLDKNCNLVLYNKTQVLWESGTFLDHTSDPCGLGLHDDWEVKISTGVSENRRKTIWSAFDISFHDSLEQLLKAELSVRNDELWLIYTFQSGAVNIEKTIKGTNHFTNNLAQSQSDLKKIILCKERNAHKSPKYRGLNLTSNSNDPKDLLLCPGDTFGDLDETYVEVENCYLAMYRKNKMIWTSKIDPSEMHDWSEKYACAFSLERNGNLILYKEDVAYLPRGPTVARILWQAQTNMNPVKTELRIEGQQIQILQVFRDGAQKLFFADANHQEFIEDMGEPIKVADQFIIKNHSDLDKIILQRNEYIGDLNGTHLILQTNCDLQLSHKNRVLWSFIPPFRHQMNCTLNIAEDHTIEISSLLTGSKESIVMSKTSLEVVESHITFEDDQPRIIQTLKDGSELVFCGAGLNNGLNLKRDLKQIAQKTIAIGIDEYDNSDYDYDSDDDDDLWVIKRMNYIGNLTGLHLILEQNCSLILANGHQKLWELQSEPPKYPNPVIECSVKLFPNGKIHLKRDVKGAQWIQPLLDRPLYPWREPEPIGVELTLEADQMIVKKEFSDRDPKIYYAGPKTDGMFFQFIAERSVFTYLGDDEDYGNEILPKMGYIGDLNGIYAILDKNCNLVLYNKTQVLWESGHSQDDAWNSCNLQIRNEGDVEIHVKKSSGTQNLAQSALDLSKKVLGVELSINDDEFWMIYTFQDGTIHEYKAITGTNRIALASKKNEFFFSGEL